MRVLDFAIEKQNIRKHGDFTGLVAGSKDYLQARFSFSSEWNGYRKAAVFTCQTGEYAEPINGCMCKVPNEVAAQCSFKVHVVGRRGDEGLLSARATVIQRRF